MNETNKHYYRDLLAYVRTHTLSKNNNDFEALLLEIFQDIIEAQSNDMTAEDFFGKNPQQIADDMIKELPNDLVGMIKSAFFAIAALAILGLSPLLFSTETSLDIGKYVLCGYLMVITFYLVIKNVGHNVYIKKQKTNVNYFLYISCA